MNVLIINFLWISLIFSLHNPESIDLYVSHSSVCSCIHCVWISVGSMDSYIASFEYGSQYVLLTCGWKSIWNITKKLHMFICFNLIGRLNDLAQIWHECFLTEWDSAIWAFILCLLYFIFPQNRHSIGVFWWVSRWVCLCARYVYLFFKYFLQISHCTFLSRWVIACWLNKDDVPNP